MKPPQLPPPIIIDTPQALHQCIHTLQHQKRIAVDTESNSLYAYHGTICLIQISTHEKDYIIDPLAVDVHPLGAVLANTHIEKIFHAAEYDLICFKREYDFDVVNIFDTMFAARILQYHEVGLGNVLYKHFGIEVDKSHQRDDWGTRPLPTDSLQYAQMDTHYLPRLRDVFYDLLQQHHHLDEAREIFHDVAQVDVKPHEFDPEGYWKLARPNDLAPREIAILRELYLLRDDIAKIEDQPPFRAIPNRVLLSIATLQPTSFHKLKKIRGFHPRLLRLYADEFLDAIHKGLHAPLPDPPPIEQPDPIIAERYMTLHAWRKERALQRDVDSNIIISKHALWKIAETTPRNLEQLAQIEGIGAWRLQTYGEELLQIVRSFKK